jgi:hypothetical protein
VLPMITILASMPRSYIEPLYESVRGYSDIIAWRESAPGGAKVRGW